MNDEQKRDPRVIIIFGGCRDRAKSHCLEMLRSLRSLDSYRPMQVNKPNRNKLRNRWGQLK